ncbi:MAG: ComF family protein [Lentisphaeria bacterium]|nr:ComF family protein [Lentisphaeria bacterium]
MIRKIFNFFAAVCPGCLSENVSAAGLLCQQYLEKIDFFDQKYRCPGCGAENHGIADLCPQCLTEPSRPWKNAFALFAYRHKGRDLIRKFKFANHPELARPLGKLAAGLIKNSNRNYDLIIPVPLNLIRSFQRGYNQSALLAKIISKECNIPVASPLKKRLSMHHQATLNRSKRHSAMKNAFYTNSNTICGKHLLLVDDVMTTGSTLSAAAKTLLAAGAADVDVIVIARSLSFTAAALK